MPFKKSQIKNVPDIETFWSKINYSQMSTRLVSFIQTCDLNLNLYRRLAERFRFDLHLIDNTERIVAHSIWQIFEFDCTSQTFWSTFQIRGTKWFIAPQADSKLFLWLVNIWFHKCKSFTFLRSLILSRRLLRISFSGSFYELPIL